ncbi:MAG: hypothetical protein ACFCU8_05910 [Thermosynechococcaceae cyanobacterium]
MTMTFSATPQSGLHAIHQANLLTSLTRRLEIAKAHHNQQLVIALESEFEQLGARAAQTSVESWFQQRWMRFSETLSEWTKVHIQHSVDAHGYEHWYVYNPQAGQALCTDSKEELNQWIKQTYWGK